MASPVQATTTALVIVDMQVAFAHQTGAYARGRQAAAPIFAPTPRAYSSQRRS